MGLAARKMEENGLSTVVLTPMPEFHRQVGIPRSAAIAFPFGRLLGDVGDSQGQKQVLTAALTVLEEARDPGHIQDLPYVWPEEPKDTHWHPPEISPIIKMHLDEIKRM